MAEFHPVVWMYDDDFKGVQYNYFNEKPIVETYEGTYADQSADIVQEYVMWNHSLAEVLQNLINEDLQIKKFQEFDWSPYPCFRHVEEFEKENGEYLSSEIKFLWFLPLKHKKVIVIKTTMTFLYI
jgi:hypothetical protein